MINDAGFIWKCDIMFEPNTIYRGDCVDLLRQFPKNSVDLIYADPPYVDKESMYGGLFNKSDHEILSKLLHETTHHVILSYNDCELIRSLYDDWNMLELETTSRITGMVQNELLLSNQDFKRRKKGHKRLDDF